MENNYSELKYDSMREKQSQKKQGILNPMYNKKHNAVTKQKISNSQKKRWDSIRKAIREINIQTDSTTSKEPIEQTPYNNTTNFKNKQQAYISFETMSKKDKKTLETYLKPFIDEAIKKYIQHVQ